MKLEPGPQRGTASPQIRLFLAAGFIILGGAAVFLFHERVTEHLAASPEDWTAFALFALGAFAWFFLSQLVIAPSGTVSIILVAAVIGWPAGALYFLAMIIAGQIVHRLARLDPGAAARTLGRAAKRRRTRAALRLAGRRAQAHPILTVAALRLVPIFPSAGCALLAGAAGLSGQALFRGTIATGWFRPLAIALFAGEIANEARSGFDISQLASNPIIWIGLGGAILPAVAAFWIARRSRRTALPPGNITGRRKSD